MALTKAQLEALKNELLASGQPINAASHRGFVQNVIDEMYDAQSRGNLLAGVQADGTTVGGDTLLLIRAGAMFLVPSSLFSAAIGSLAGLSDTVLSNPQNGQTLVYNGVLEKWENADRPVGPPLAKVRTQTGFFDPAISGTTPIGIFQTPFSWLASYFSIGAVIEIDLVGTFTTVSSSFLVNLRIGTDNYSGIEMLSSGGNDEVFRVSYKITLSVSNEIKIATNINTPAGLSFTYFETATKNMDAAFDIDVRAKFIAPNAGNNVKSNLIEVKVY